MPEPPHHARGSHRWLTSIPAVLAATIGIATANLQAQDEAYEAWTRVFDALDPDWQGTGSEDPIGLISREDLEILRDYGSGPVRTPTARERAAFERLDTLAPLLVEATSHRTFDPGVDWNEGFNVQLRHLSPMRLSAQCVRALSHRAAAAGNTADAATWTGRLAVTAGLVSQDGSLLGSLVGGAIFSTADSELDWLTSGGMLDAETAEATLEGVAWFGEAADPFGVMNAMVMERDIMALEMTRLADAIESGDLAATNPLFQYLRDSGVDTASLTADMVRDQADAIFDLQDRMIDAAADPDRQRGLETMRAIEAEIESADGLDMIALLVPSASRMLEMRVTMEDALFDRLRLLEAIAEGRVSSEDAANGAILWDRLGTLFETLPGSVQLAGLMLVDQAPTPERLEILVARAVGEPASELREILDADAGEDAPSMPLDTWWTGTSDVEAEIREVASIATAVTRADFPASRGMVERHRVASNDLARLRGAGRGLVIDATARLRAAMSPPSAEDDADATRRVVDAEAERDAANEEMVAALALVHDLLSDPALSHVVLATNLIGDIVQVLRSEEAAPMLADPTRRDRIISAVNAIPRATTLGSADAATADIDLFVAARASALDDEERRRLQDRLTRLGADRTYAFLLADAGFAIRSAQPPNGDVPTPITPPAEAEDQEIGYRPLRLIATLEGMHGEESVLAREPALSTALRDRIREDGGRPRLDRVLPFERFTLDFRAGEALVAISELDDFLIELGRAPSP